MKCTDNSTKTVSSDDWLGSYSPSGDSGSTGKPAGRANKSATVRTEGYSPTESSDPPRRSAPARGRGGRRGTPLFDEADDGLLDVPQSANLPRRPRQKRTFQVIIY